ncbi:MAG: dephospho-CoA kinase [Sphaerochaeta sp.]
MIIALVGKSCSGKNLVGGILEKNGLTVWDTDRMCHDGLDLNYDAVVKAFGSEITENISGKRVISRAALGKIVFSNPDKRVELESILYPWLKSKVLEWKEKAENTEKNLVLNGALMYRSGFLDICSCVIYVDASYEIRLERAKKRDGITEEAFKKREAAQADVDFRDVDYGLPLYVVTNNEPNLDKLNRQVFNICDKLGILNGHSQLRGFTMKKTKLILLTVLIILVLYCGAVIFVTKPDTFAYEALFGELDNAVTVPTSEKAAADAAAEKKALLSEIDAMVTEKNAATVKEAVSIADANTAKAIENAVAKYDADIAAMVKSSVNEAVGSIEVNADVSAELEKAVPEIVEKVTAELEANIGTYVPRIVEASVTELLKYQDELAQLLYEKYKDRLVALVTAELKTEESAAAQTPIADTPVEKELEASESNLMPKEEYDLIRTQTRESEINEVLDKLSN